MNREERLARTIRKTELRFVMWKSRTLRAKRCASSRKQGRVTKRLSGELTSYTLSAAESMVGIWRIASRRNGN
jgi:hypothetical protein